MVMVLKKERNVEIGGRVRKCRESLGYSRESLAEQAELAVSFLSSIELGMGSFSVETLAKLCRTLEVSADFILFGREEELHLDRIRFMLSTVEERYLPHIEAALSAHIQSIRLAEEEKR